MRVHDSGCFLFGLRGGGAKPRSPSSPVVSVRLLGRPVVERRVRSALVVEAHPPADPGPGMGAGGKLGLVDALVFERAPQPLDEDVIHPATLAIHRDLDAGALEDFGELQEGESSRGEEIRHRREDCYLQAG